MGEQLEPFREMKKTIFLTNEKTNDLKAFKTF